MLLYITSICITYKHALNTDSQIRFEKCCLNLMDVLLLPIKVKETNSFLFNGALACRPLRLISVLVRERDK